MAWLAEVGCCFRGGSLALVLFGNEVGREPLAHSDLEAAYARAHTYRTGRLIVAGTDCLLPTKQRFHLLLPSVFG